MPKLLYLFSEDWAFSHFFLPMVRAARAAGFEVVVATRVRNHADRIAAAGCRVVPLEAERRSLNPIEMVRGMARIARIVRDERPDVVHCIALRMVVLGALAARLAGARDLVLAPTGLGHLWVENGPIERLARPLVRLLVGRLLRSRRTQYLFENVDDPREFGLDPVGPDVTVVGGTGIDPALFPFTAEPPAPPVKVAIVARMIVPKGIAEAVAAIGRARQQGAAVELDIYGAPDPSNRRSYSDSEVRRWSAEPGVTWHGPTNDVGRVWREHHIAMLLSYREGLPRSLVEAAASGRPVVTTDVPGCREAVRDRVEGLVVPLGNIEAAAGALVELARDPALRAQLGKAANARFNERFTVGAVEQVISGLYRRILASLGPDAR